MTSSAAPISLMARETAEIPTRVDRQGKDCAETFERVGTALRSLAPPLVATIARGSSDHAATYLKALIELLMGVPVASISPSVASVYSRQLGLSGAASFAISQSGASPDLIAAHRMTIEGGALPFAIVNVEGAPILAEGVRHIPIEAGPEHAVAATKTFVGSLTAMAWTLVQWSEDRDLRRAMEALPDVLDQALDADWTPALDAFGDARSAFVLGRGPALGIANEAALKFKETCELHAEGFSAAEVLHGPLQLAAADLVVLAFVTGDAARSSTIKAIERLASSGNKVFVADTEGSLGRESSNVVPLPATATGHPLIDPISLIMSFYVFVERLARERGHDPDAPSLLAKVTRTR